MLNVNLKDQTVSLTKKSLIIFRLKISASQKLLEKHNFVKKIDNIAAWTRSFKNDYNISYAGILSFQLAENDHMT